MASALEKSTVTAFLIAGNPASSEPPDCGVYWQEDNPEAQALIFKWCYLRIAI